MPPPISNKPYTKPPIRNELLAFIKTLGYDEDPIEKLTSILYFVATRLHQPWRAILSAKFKGKRQNSKSRPDERQTKMIYTRITKLIIDHFLSTNKSIPRRSNADMHSEEHDYPMSKLINTIEGEFMFGMEIPNIMITDAIKESAGYKVWKLIDTPYRAMWDMAYWGFLGVRTTFDIFQNILLLYCEYGVLMSPGYGVLGLQSYLSFVNVARYAYLLDDKDY
ncbi:hypothetical protein Tco_1162602 [Tanacetum coccineum]